MATEDPNVARLLELREAQLELLVELMMPAQLRAWCLARIRAHLEVDGEGWGAMAGGHAELRRVCGEIVELRGGRELGELLYTQLLTAELSGFEALCWRRMASSAGHSYEQVRQLREALVHSYRPLVVAIARGCLRGNLHLALPDLIQEGYLGLLQALERFDPERGKRISSYAAIWIRSAIMAAINTKEREVRIPQYLLTAQRRLRRARANFATHNDREASVDELRACTELSREVVDRVATLETMQRTGFDEAVCGQGIVRDAPDELLESRDIVLRLAAKIAELPGIEGEVLSRRFGLFGDEPQTLRAVGERFSLSAEGIRKAQNRAIRRLRESFAEC